MSDARRFRGRPEAVPAARRFVRGVLSAQPPEVIDAAELMASEVATNCVRHAHTGFELTIHSKGQIRIEVRDTGEGRPTLLSPGLREPSGRGLRIVEAMSEDWGVIPASEGKTVWFTVPKPGSSGKAPPTAASQNQAAKGRDLPDEPAGRRLRASRARPRPERAARRLSGAHGRE